MIEVPVNIAKLKYGIIDILRHLIILEENEDIADILDKGFYGHFAVIDLENNEIWMLGSYSYRIRYDLQRVGFKWDGFRWYKSAKQVSDRVKKWLANKGK
jgi:hypothetical protein